MIKPIGLRVEDESNLVSLAKPQVEKNQCKIKLNLPNLFE